MFSAQPPWWHYRTLTGRCLCALVAVPAVSSLGAMAVVLGHGGARWAVYGVSVVLVSLAVLAVAFHLLRPAGRQLAALAVAWERAADGDLTTTLDDRPDSRDTLAMINRSHDRAMHSMRQALHEVASIGASMRVQGEEIRDIAATLSSTAENTVNETLAAQSAAADVSNNMHVVASANEEMAATVRDIAASASDAATLAVAAVRNAGSAGESAQTLVVQAVQLGEISNVISDLARQTRLLALNARIEASRSDTSDGGFLVVADEVKSLATHSSTATERVSERVAEIQAGSSSVNAALQSIGGELRRVTETQTAIASAVEQQLAVTAEISTVAAFTATGSQTISDNILRMSHTMRRIAYGGSQARNTATELADLDARLTRLLMGFALGAVDAADEAVGHRRVAFKRGDTRVIPSDVTGVGQDEFDYSGSWCHSDSNESGDSDAYTSMPGDVATLRFVGTSATYVGVADAHHGIAAVSIDGGAEAEVDLYAPERLAAPVWESGRLAPGPHTLRIRVTEQKNPASRYYWVTIDRVEIT